MRRVLKDTGSIYFHCDPTMSHYIKIMMDMIFGEKNFVNEIVWHYRAGTARKKGLGKKHDIIFYYIKDINSDWIFNVWKEKIPENQYYRYNLMDDEGNRYRLGGSNDTTKYFLKDGRQATDTWVDINIINKNAKERKGYPTQKPLKLLERIIKESSKENDVILDPFCGCATTCIASEKLNRKWIGIDISIKAYDLVKERLNKEVEGKFDFQDKNGNGIKVHFSTDSPKRTDRNKDDRLKKYIYVISHPKFEGYYKVGIAKDYKTRLNSYQTSDPDRAYKMEYFYLTPHFRETEKYIHNLFDNKFEWIKANLKDIVQKIENYKDKE